MEKTPFCIILVSCPDLEQSKKLAQGLVEGKLAACVTLMPKAVSCYYWKGKLETTEQTILLVKTRSTAQPTAMRYIREHHSDSVPEILCLPIVDGDSTYLNWLGANTVRA